MIVNKNTYAPEADVSFLHGLDFKSLAEGATYFIDMNIEKTTETSGIYKISWKNNSYYYYGQAINLKIRWRNHLIFLKKNKHNNSIIQRVFNKYGEPFFSIVELCSKENLNTIEQKYLDLFFGDKFCCNILPIAQSSVGYKHTQETLSILSENWMKTHWDGQHNETYIENQRKRAIDNNMGTYLTDWVKKNGGARTKENISHKERTRLISLITTCRAIPILCVETGIVFKSIYQAGKQMKIPRGTLANHLGGKETKTANGYTFKKLEPKDYSKVCIVCGCQFSTKYDKQISCSKICNNIRQKQLAPEKNKSYYKKNREKLILYQKMRRKNKNQ